MTRYLRHAAMTMALGAAAGFLASLLPPAGSAQQDQERVVRKLGHASAPVEIKVVKVKKGTFELGRHFPDDDDWFKGLRVSVENTSGKTIVYIGGGFLFPRPKGHDADDAAPPRYHDFMYGRHPLAPEKARLAHEPISIKPGETFDLTISESDYDLLTQRLKELKYPAGVKEIDVNVEEVYFDDGTAWIGGGWYQRDPARPEKYKRVETPLPGEQGRIKRRRAALVKAAYSYIQPVQTGSCWANDGFFSVSCTDDNPSNCWRRKALVRIAAGEIADTKLLTVMRDCRTEFGFGPVTCKQTLNQIHVSCQPGDCINIFPCAPGTQWNYEECRCIPKPAVSICQENYAPGVASIGDGGDGGATPNPNMAEGGGGGCGCDAVERNDCMSGGGEWSEAYCTCVSPVVIDVAGDGFDLTDGAGGVMFDFTGEGSPTRLAWTRAGSDDAWLFLDRNGNGAVDSGQELFGTHTPQPAPDAGEHRNGFRALAVYDLVGNGGNSDGVIDARDTVFPSLRLWRDANHDGVSQPAELHALASLGVAALHLDYKESKRTDAYGNRFRYRAKVNDAKGSKVSRWAWDVFLVRTP